MQNLYLFFYNSHGKNDFTEISKNLARYRYENNFLNQNNYVGCSNIIANNCNTAKSFATLITSLSVLHNYFNNLKLFSDLYLL